MKTIYQRIMRAAERRTGMRLSADEVFYLSCNQAIEQTALNDDADQEIQVKCQRCRGTGKLDRGNGTTRPCDCAAGEAERKRRAQQTALRRKKR